MDLIDFKRVNGKYKIEEQDWIKIYNSFTNNLIFEGYYSNKKINGKRYEFNEKCNIILKENIYMIKNGKENPKNMMTLLEN